MLKQTFAAAFCLIGEAAAPLAAPSATWRLDFYLTAAKASRDR
jgi:hypothetical protein